MAKKRVLLPLPTGTINGHYWVDLGLPSALKWATCNVEASQPHQYGNYYAWGETTIKTEYTPENSVVYNRQISDISGNSTYDVARAKWGGSWRIPTKTEMLELINNCTWTWITQNGINGMKVVESNGNSIFLPAASLFYGASQYSVGENGSYWTSIPYRNNSGSIYVLDFKNGIYNVNWCAIYYGFTVRPVSN